MVKHTCILACSVSSCAVIVKIERSTSLSHASVVECISEAESKVPKYLSRRETEEAIAGIRSSIQGFRAHHACTTLNNFLPDIVLLCSSFSKHEARLLKDTTALLLSSDTEDV